MPQVARFTILLIAFLLAGVATGQDKAPSQPAPSQPAPSQTAPSQPAPAQPPAPPQQPPDHKLVAANVNGTPIFERDVFRAVSKATGPNRERAREQILNFLIDNALVDQYLEQLKVPVEPKDVEQAVLELKKEVGAKDPNDFNKLLQDLILTEAELRVNLTAEVRWQKFLEKYAPEKVLTDFFGGNKNFFDGSQVHARHILVPAKRDDAKEVEAAKLRAALLRKQIEERAVQELSKLPPAQDNLEKEKARNKALESAFAEIAGKESSCPSKEQGGDVGWFARTGLMVEPFARTAFGLKPYQLSEPVVTEFGCHLILPTETKPGREVKYEDMKDVVKAVYGERMREAIVERSRPTARIAIAPVGKQ